LTSTSETDYYAIYIFFFECGIILQSDWPIGLEQHWLYIVLDKLGWYCDVANVIIHK